MTKRRREAPDALGDLSRVDIAWLTDQPKPEWDDMTTSERWDAFEHEFLESDHLSLAVPSARDKWLRYRDAILSDWIEQYPRSRPTCWWRFDAPVREDWMPRGDAGYHWKQAPDARVQIDYLQRHDLLTEAERDALSVQRITQ